MEYKEIRKLIEEAAENNYGDLVKAIIGWEKGINDEQTLDKVYSAFMQSDSMELLNVDISEEIEKVLDNQVNHSIHL